MQFDRLFEYTADAIEARFRTEAGVDFAALSRMPALFMHETHGNGEPFARVGYITNAVRNGASIDIEYHFDQEVPPIPEAVLLDHGGELQLDDWEYSRTHWAIKDVDLYRFICRHYPRRRHLPNVFRLAEVEQIEDDLVSVMMPFSAEYRPVYDALRAMAEARGLRCVRADDVWDDNVVMNDVVSLIDRSKVVIADCSGKNPNVFYETGIAHTLGRDVILITRSADDIPFDLRHLRYVAYLNNEQGLSDLCNQIAPRLPG